MKKNSHLFQRNIITCVILSTPLLLFGCKSGNDSSSAVTPSTPDGKRAPVVYPITLPDPISPLHATTINMKTAIESDGPSQLQSVMQRQGSSSACDNQPKTQENSIMVYPQRSKSAEPALCAYDYTVESNGHTAQSTLAFAVSQSGALTPTLPWIGVIGAVGEDIPATISVPAGGTLNASVLVLGDATAPPTVDTTAKTITLSSDAVGVTRVMYTVTDAGGEVQVGVVDFTVTQDVSVAPTAQRGDATLANATAEATYDLTNFTPINGGSPISLVTAKNSDGSNAGTSGLTLTKIVPSLGINAEIVPPLSIKVTASRAGVFPIYYQVSDGQGDIAYNLLNVVVEGPTGLLLRDARYSLEPTANSRTLKIDAANFAMTPSSVGQFELVANSVKITSKQAPSGSRYTATATQADGSTVITYTYGGSDANGISNITYQLKDKATGLIADGNIFISVGDQLPAFSTFTVSGVAAGASPETGDALTGVATCDAATGCDNSKTKWTWRQSGDTVTTGVGPTESGYTVQYFPCEDDLELWATPVGTYTEGGVTKEVEGLPVRKSWVSPDVLTARLSKTSAKEGEEVTLTIQACSAAPATTVSITGGLDRQGRAQTDNLAKIKRADGILVASESVVIPAGGETDLTIVAPKGGLKSTISITSNGKSIEKDVTFSTLTSPNVPQANRYGHMPNYEDIGGGLIWLRAQLVGETILASDQYTLQHNLHENYVGGNTDQISRLCQSLSSSMYGVNTTQPRIPVLTEGQAYRDFVVAKGFSNVVSYNGWTVWARLGTVFTPDSGWGPDNYGLIMVDWPTSNPDYVEPFIGRSSAYQTDGWAFCVANKI
ncbi:hypothetical protein C0W96_01160 [Photobacterium kishitanii]|uniref:hypothetical protein n=1 Tax=Photobacterium kishitanii TaxID=318456 RepID=UPI0005D32534|nr:hypothetical protein [Photobacterium kishitanii]KJG09540.1 hypothetical protein UB40_12555 [Photobacterium kishitanii]PSV07892.1 hypothetical protein C0W96_01160 [Photobacterium kishitanii]PSV71429.1 hypothetical protein C0W29_21155 [Photobacterium kishitanii]